MFSVLRMLYNEIVVSAQITRLISSLLSDVRVSQSNITHNRMKPQDCPCAHCASP